jgi:hypothetical protein
MDILNGYGWWEQPLYKTDFIRKNGMASFHFHDRWHRRSPDGIAVGMARELGWDKYIDPNNPRLFTFAAGAFGEARQGHAGEAEYTHHACHPRSSVTGLPGQRQVGILRPVSGH